LHNDAYLSRRSGFTARLELVRLESVCRHDAHHPVRIDWARGWNDAAAAATGAVAGAPAVAGSGLWVETGGDSCCCCGPVSGNAAPRSAPVNHTHPFNGPMSGTTWVSQYQKGKTHLDFTEARDSE